MDSANGVIPRSLASHVRAGIVNCSQLRVNLAPAGSGARPLDYLNKSTFRETYYLGPGDDQVIEDSYVHKAQGITQALRNQFICRRRLSDF